MTTHLPVRWGSIVLLALLTTAPLRGQGNGFPAPEVDPSTKRARAVRIQGDAPRVDGSLNDAVWRTAHFISDFVQKQPLEGAAPTERTEVAFIYDDRALYVGARMYSDEPGEIQALVSRRDRGGQSQHVWISLDTYRDRRTAYSFGVTASGVRMDWYHARDDERAIDLNFDPVWEAKTRIDSLGWTAEMRIPFSQLRFNDVAEQVWGLNIDRWIPERNESVFWIPVPSSVRAWSSRMGTLEGIRGVRPSRRVELLPYAASAATVHGEVDPSDPFASRANANVRAGADLKMGLGPNLTLDATFNPDFGQVEADPAVVNLSAFEVFFPERRPFFQEGAQLLSGGGAGYFYSRRIGQRPGGPASGDFVDRPETSTILGAAKLTGRTGHGLSLGALAAVTAREWARTYDAAVDEFGRSVVAAPAAYGVIRAQQEFGANASTVGGILTGVRRALSPGTALTATTNRTAVTGGGDWNLRFDGGRYRVGGNVGFSYVEGDAIAILGLQRSSARYFQRPDANHVRVDSTRRSLFGYVAGLSVSKINGAHWLWDISGYWESPGFELNDIGRLGTADEVGAFAEITYRETQPKGILQRWSVSLSQENLFNTALERQFGAIRTDAFVTFTNFWRATLTAWVDFRAQNQRLTRGGPSMATPAAWVTIVSLSNSAAATTGWRGRIYYGRNELGGFTYRLSGGLQFRPGPQWDLSIAPNYLRYVRPRQYVRALPGGPTETFGTRYVFAFIDRSDWLVELRLNYAITPDLTVELYAEPFAASGRYFDHGELTRARESTLATYGAGGTTIVRAPDGSYSVTDGDDTFTLPFLDFNVRSLRSNLIVRWEWLPGSTLFLVWQQDRASFERAGDLVRLGSLFGAFRAPGTNFFAVKASYWLAIP